MLVQSSDITLSSIILIIVIIMRYKYIRARSFRVSNAQTKINLIEIFWDENNRKCLFKLKIEMEQMSCILSRKAFYFLVAITYLGIRDSFYACNERCH